MASSPPNQRKTQALRNPERQQAMSSAEEGLDRRLTNDNEADQA